MTSVNPLLGPLSFNGGTTRTQLLLAGSPALNTGANPLSLATDQRGAGFPRTLNGTTDMGACEVDTNPPPLSSAPIPTLSKYSLALLSLLMVGMGWATIRRRS